MEKILVTGGAGYIGSVLVKMLCDKGYRVFVVDDLSKGKLSKVDKRAKLFKMDLRKRIKDLPKADVVMHLASYKSVDESMKDPKKYSGNIAMTVNILDYMAKAKAKKIIFSSTAAVYGTPKYLPVDEKHPLNPANYYGETKLISERIIEWYSRIYGFDHVLLRYFNVIGDPLKFKERGENIMPSIMDVIRGKKNHFIIFGKDYNTKDGTAIRDYIDVRDLAKAHILAIKKGSGAINLGTGKGYSVKEIVDIVEKVHGRIKKRYGKMRQGDIGTIYASNKKAKITLGWKPDITISESIKSI